MRGRVMQLGRKDSAERIAERSEQFSFWSVGLEAAALASFARRRGFRLRAPARRDRNRRPVTLAPDLVSGAGQSVALTHASSCGFSSALTASSASRPEQSARRASSGVKLRVTAILPFVSISSGMTSSQSGRKARVACG